MNRDHNQKDSRLAKYFMNKLAKSKSIADISQRGLNLTKIAPPVTDESALLQSQYASTARNAADSRFKSGRGLGQKVASPDGQHGDAEREGRVVQGHGVEAEEGSLQERVLNKSQSLTKNALWNPSTRFNATCSSSYIVKNSAKPRQQQNMSVGGGEHRVKGLRNRSFLGKQQQRGFGAPCAPEESAGYIGTNRRKPLYMQQHNTQLKRNNPSYMRDVSNPKNLSINSRLYNPRPLNNLSKNMSIKEEQDGFTVDLGQMQAEVIKERGLDGSQYDNVSMGSIGSFEKGKQPKELIDPEGVFDGDKKDLIPVINKSSPGKIVKQQPIIGSFRQTNKANLDSNFYTQGTEKNSSSKKLELNTNKMTMFGKGGASQAKRTPLTSKYSQIPRISKHGKKQSTGEFEFIRKYTRDNQQVDQTNNNSSIVKMNSIVSPLKYERASQLVKNKLISSGKIGHASTSDQSKMWKTHRASQQVGQTTISTSMHKKTPSNVINGQNNTVYHDLDAKINEIPSGESGHNILSASNIQLQSNRIYYDQNANNITEYQNEDIPDSFPSYGATLPGAKRDKRHGTRPKNADISQQAPSVFSPTLQTNEGKAQKLMKTMKICSPGYNHNNGVMSPLTPVSTTKRGDIGSIISGNQTTTNNKSKHFPLGQLTNGLSYPKKSLRENKSVKNIVAVPSHQVSGQPSGAAQPPTHKEHKRSMTLATRDGMGTSNGKVFQSIIEETAEDVARSIETKSKDGTKSKQWTTQIPRVGQRKQSRGQSQFYNQSSKLANRGASQAKDHNNTAQKQYLGQNQYKNTMKMPRGSLNIKSEQLQQTINKTNTYQVQQQYGLLSTQTHLQSQIPSKQKPSAQGSHPETQPPTATTSARNNSQVPQNTRQRSFLRTTRNTIAQQQSGATKQDQGSQPSIMMPSARYAQYYQNNNSRKAADRNLTFLQEFKKTNQQNPKLSDNLSKTSQSRPISTSKKQDQSSTAITQRGIPHLPIGTKFSKQTGSTQDQEGDQNQISARRRGNLKANQSKERQQSVSNDPSKKNQLQKKCLTSKKSIHNQSKIELLDEGVVKQTIQKPQINNLVGDGTAEGGKQSQQEDVSQNRKNQVKKQAKALYELKKHDQKSANDGETTKQVVPSLENADKFAVAGTFAQTTKAQLQSNTNPQQPSSSLSGMFLSKSQLTTSRSPRKDDISTERQTQQQKPSVPEFPLTSDEALTHFSKYLNDFEKQEVQKYSGKIFYLGQKCANKVKGHAIKMIPNPNPDPSTLTNQKLKDKKNSSSFQSNPGPNGQKKWEPMIPSIRQVERLQQMDIFNYGYDDENGDYQTVLKDHLGYRFEVLQALGSGSFGQALKCLDHQTGQEVAVKIIRSKKKFQYQAGMELKILLYLNKHDKQDQNNVIRVKDFMLFRDHLIIAFELLSINLYEFIKNNNFQGVSQNLIRRFAIQILQALKYHHDHSLVHCDMKPENILLKQENKSGIKVIDYGSSCFMGQRIYTYIQSRFYRAPEIILGIPYTTAIDMWSFGAIVAELYTGFPLFPGESEMEQLAYIMELYGVPPDNVLQLATRCEIFFTEDYVPKLQPNSRGKIRYPNQKKLEDVLRCNDESFLDFLNKCFVWDPVQRMTALEALQHPWILEGLPEKVLKHHKKMFGYKDDKAKMHQLTLTDIQGFPKDKKDQSIYDILDEIRQDQEKEKQILLAKSRLESSRNNLTRQTFKTSERDKTSRAEEGSEIMRSQKSLRSQLHNQGQPPSLEVAEIHKQTNKMAQTQLVKLPSNFKANQQSPNKERKSRKQRMENSEMKISHKLSQYQGYDNEVTDDAPCSSQLEDKQSSSMVLNQTQSSKRKSTSIKVYKPELDDYQYQDMDHHYMNKLAALKAQFEQETKKLDEIEEKMINLEADNSVSQARDEDIINRHINSIQTNLLNNKLQVTHEVPEQIHSTTKPQYQYGQVVHSSGLQPIAISSQQLSNFSSNKDINSQNLSQVQKYYGQKPELIQSTSQHYKPKRKSQQKSIGSDSYLNQPKTSQQSSADIEGLSKFQYTQDSQINAMSMVYQGDDYQENEVVVENIDDYQHNEMMIEKQKSASRQPSSKNALVVQTGSGIKGTEGIQSRAGDEEDDHDDDTEKDLTPLQYNC